MKRRQFLKDSVIGGAALSLCTFLKCSKSNDSLAFKLGRRVLGKTGVTLPLIGFGGLIVRDILKPKWFSDLILIQGYEI